MEKLDTLVAAHIEHRLLQPSRLEKILSSILGRREVRAERQATHIAVDLEAARHSELGFMSPHTRLPIVGLSDSAKAEVARAIAEIGDEDLACRCEVPRSASGLGLISFR